jgi:hypoxanthine phosphoribosyltransferase
MNPADAWKALDQSDEICSAQTVEAAIDRVAREIAAKLAHEFPLVLSIMGGAVVFTGHLLPRLRFPLEFDTIHVSRYRDGTRGGVITWKVAPHDNVAGRTVLVVDDILDEGDTLAEVKRRIMAAGAKEFYSAVFADKDIGRAKPITPDFVGVTLPNRYVFGFGMDVSGAWRNLPTVRALR